MQHTGKLQGQQKCLIKISGTSDLKWPDVDEPTIPITTVLAILAELLEASAIDVASVSVCVGGMGMCGGVWRAYSIMLLPAKILL